MVTKKEVLQVLKKCYDPEIPVSIVDLGLIYDIKVKGSNVNIKMTLTSPHCPMHSFLSEMVKERISKIKGVKKVNVDLVFDPPWSPERMSKKAKKILSIE